MWSSVRMWMKTVVGTVVVVVPITITALDVFGYVARVDGVSMQPILNPDYSEGKKDLVFLNKWGIKSYNFQRGEIVAFTSPRDPKKSLIKRIVGFEGDTVRKRSKKSQYDGAIVSTVTIPRGHCWVEGENKRSLDSNYFGPIPLALIKAKASHIVWPPSRRQKLEPSIAEPQRIWRGTNRTIYSQTDHT